MSKKIYVLINDDGVYQDREINTIGVFDSLELAKKAAENLGYKKETTYQINTGFKDSIVCFDNSAGDYMPDYLGIFEFRINEIDKEDSDEQNS